MARAETLNLEVGRTKSQTMLFTAKQPRGASCTRLLMTIYELIQPPTNPTSMGWAGLRWPKIDRPNPFVILAAALSLTNFNLR